MNRITLNRLVLEDFKTDCNEAFCLLYKKYFPYTKKFILLQKGTLEDAEDIFQDAVLVLYEKLYSEDFQVYTCIGNYIQGIAKNIWYKKLQQKKLLIENPEKYYQEHQQEINEAIENEREYWNKLEDYLTKISAHCQKLIFDLFIQHKKIEEIQQEYGYTTRHNAQNQKHKCVEQIKRIKDLDKKL